MGQFATIIAQSFGILSMDMDIYGFTLSYGQMFVWSCMAGILITVIYKLLDNDNW